MIKRNSFFKRQLECFQVVHDSKKLATKKNPTIACITAYKMAGEKKIYINKLKGYLQPPVFTSVWPPPQAGLPEKAII